jgi:uncharacterized repeat protein (TIGR03803 family)
MSIREADEEKSMTRINKFAVTLLATIVVSAATYAHAQYSVLYSFQASGGVDAVSPLGAIAQGEDGSLYSTAQTGGANDWGAVWKITPAGSERLLYSFCSATNCTDGDTPVSGLTLRPNSHFLGTTGLSDGFNGPGTIFDVSQAGSLSTLFTFSTNTNGAAPATSPILGPDGAFYGVASSGGASDNCGTVYRLSAAFAVIHTFDKTHGCGPVGLVLGTDGSFYGTTATGGTSNSGVVFKLTYRPGLATLFSVITNVAATNGSPVGSLVEGSDGNFYGVTAGIQKSGTTSFGSVFQVIPSGVLTTLHELNGTTDGAFPTAGLTFASDGNLYGTASGGGAGVGTLFQSTLTGDFTVLNTFTGENSGSNPSNTVQHTNGLLYGVTSFGGAFSGFGYDCSLNSNDGCGVVYSWNGSLPPFVSTVQLMGAVGSTIEILGQGFTSTTTVSFNGTAASATIQSGTSLFATVPTGATTGPVTVTTSTGTLTSNRPFIVVP